MKLKHVGMIVVSVLAMSSAAVSAAEGDESVTTTVNGGVIHFKGEVVNAACAIDSESMNQTVELGQVRSSRLAKAGDLSSAVGFNIKLHGQILSTVRHSTFVKTAQKQSPGKSRISR